MDTKRDKDKLDLIFKLKSKIKKLTKNLLIVGGTGFIGRHLVLRCLKKRWNVTSISLDKKKNKEKINKVNYLLF